VNVRFFIIKEFQSTHPRRVRRQDLPLRGLSSADFNPRTREGCDDETGKQLFSKSGEFQSTHPRRVRLHLIRIRSGSGHFNPRTREGCDHVLLELVAHLFEISIHAPAKGATLLAEIFRIDPEVFQSTHPRRVRRPANSSRTSGSSNFNPRTREGCDSNSPMLKNPVEYFNPRTREGCDPGPGKGDAVGIWISIHAPAKGATASCRIHLSPCSTFQSTHPRRVRLLEDSITTKTNPFQSTHPRRVRPAGCRRCCRSHRDFNPRTREGCDVFVHVGVGVGQVISIHAPAKGATSAPITGSQGARFQSTHPRRVRLS